MSFIQITAILSLLIAFGVDAPTVSHIHDLLIPPTASTTPIAAVPVIGNAPVYFGSIAPAPTPPPETFRVVQSPTMKELDASFIGGSGQSVQQIELFYSENGTKLADVPITLSASEGKFYVDGTNQLADQIIAITKPNGTGRGVNGAIVGYVSGGIDFISRDDFGSHEATGGAFYPGATITFTANGITKTLQAPGVYKIIPQDELIKQ